MTRMLRWLGAGLVVLSLCYVGRSLIGHLDGILALEWGSRGIAVTVAGTIVYALGLLALPTSWTLIAVSALPDGRR